MEKKKKEDKYYLPRDISWMYFNRRILQEAMKERVPILERLSFLGIYSNNLDEFLLKAGWPSAKIKRRILNGKKH